MFHSDPFRCAGIFCCDGVSLGAHLGSSIDSRSQELEYGVVLEPFCDYNSPDFNADNLKGRSFVVVEITGSKSDEESSLMPGVAVPIV